MPRGTYVVAGRPEPFSCAPGPAGWRYTSPRLDLICDSRFRSVRVQITCDTAWVRGGRTVLDDGTPVLTWVTSSDTSAERSAVADVVDTDSPGSLVGLARRVAGPGATPVDRVLPAVRFAAPALAGLSVRLRLARVSATDHDGLLVERWTVDDVDAGSRTEAHLAGDVVVWAYRGGEEPWEVELAELDSPPSGLVGEPPA